MRCDGSPCMVGISLGKLLQELYTSAAGVWACSAAHSEPDQNSSWNADVWHLKVKITSILSGLQVWPNKLN
jgi:hypothetical protein